jgi:hypothetical protein
MEWLPERHRPVTALCTEPLDVKYAVGADHEHCNFGPWVR